MNKKLPWRLIAAYKVMVELDFTKESHALYIIEVDKFLGKDSDPIDQGKLIVRLYREIHNEVANL